MKNFRLDFEPYTRRDPVSGVSQTLIRNKHSHQSSPRLLAFQKCVRRNLEGHTARGGDARANSVAIRSGLAGAARACSGGRASAG